MITFGNAARAELDAVDRFTLDTNTSIDCAVSMSSGPARPAAHTLASPSPPEEPLGSSFDVDRELDDGIVLRREAGCAPCAPVCLTPPDMAAEAVGWGSMLGNTSEDDP
jgi:hypothetical protein